MDNQQCYTYVTSSSRNEPLCHTYVLHGSERVKMCVINVIKFELNNFNRYQCLITQIYYHIFIFLNT